MSFLDKETRACERCLFLAHTVTPVNCRAAFWNESSQSRQFYCTSLGVAKLCSLMVDLISDYSLVTWSWLGQIRDNGIL